MADEITDHGIVEFRKVDKGDGKYVGYGLEAWWR